MRFLKFFFLSFLTIVGLGALGAGLAIWYFASELPDSDTLARYEPPVTTRVHAYDGTLIAEFARERRLFVPIDDIPPLVKNAFIAAEDKSFYIHPGFDPLGIARALWSNFNSGDGRRPEGASTITQQVARNFFFSQDVDYIRKIKEILLSMRIEATFSKGKILELYLNQIFLGQNSYGVAAAALNYFDKSLDELTTEEVAYLAALPKAPSTYHPITQKARALERRNYVIDQMRDAGFISAEEQARAKATDLVVNFRPLGIRYEDANYFAEEARRVITNRYGEETLMAGGLSVRTTLDSKMQSLALKAFRTGLQRYDRVGGWNGPVAEIELGAGWEKRLGAIPWARDVTNWRLAVVQKTGGAWTIGFADGTTGSVPEAGRKLGGSARAKPGDVIYVETTDEKDAYALRQIPRVNGGLVILDPHSSRVLALVGGFSYYDSVFNRATQAMRQTGSAFKPFVYAAALDAGYTPSSLVLDGPVSLPMGNGRVWRPQNSDGRYMGMMTLRRGLEQSRNLMTVRLAYDVGMKNVVERVKKAGVYDKIDPVLANALGASETTVMKLAGGYATFLNGGRVIAPTIIDRIQDRYGKTVFRHDDRSCEGCYAPNGWANQEEPLLPNIGREEFDPRTGFQVASILQGVVTRGTARNAFKKLKDFPIGGKTGTTNDSKDVWFVGFTADLIVASYVGYDQPKSLRRGSFGGTVVAPIVADIFQQILPETGALPLRTPPGVVMMRVNASSGRPTSAEDPGAIMEPFKLGTDPDSKEANTAGADEADYPAEEAPPPPPESVSTGTGGLY
jgi:penicillin-binding protein 1A